MDTFFHFNLKLFVYLFIIFDAFQHLAAKVRLFCGMDKKFWKNVEPAG